MVNRKMFLVLVLLGSVVMHSCSPNWHIKRAKFKQPDILSSFNDTIRFKDLRVDTIYYEDTFAIVQTVVERDTIIEVHELTPKTRFETRWKYKTIRDTVKIKEKFEYKEAKQKQKTERKESNGYWYIWIIIGAVAYAFISRWLRGALGR
jgi:hypothetical protein